MLSGDFSHRHLWYHGTRSELTFPFGLQMHSGNNTGVGRDHTIYSLIDGVVVFTEKQGVKVT